MPSRTSGSKIAIIGAGPGGLLLANILQNNNIPFFLFDLDNSASERAQQGGSLDLHPDGGQLAIHEAGVWEAFTQHARPESDVLKIVQLNGEVLWDGNTTDKRVVKESEKFDGKPEIDRGVLNELLLEPLGKEFLRWGQKLVEVVPQEHEIYDLHFADGSVEKDFNLVIGADGAWSRVRRLLTDVVPKYAGITAIELWSLHPTQWMSSYAGAGSMFSFGEGRAFIIQRQGDESIRTYACIRKPETWLKDCGIDWTVPETARKTLVQDYFADCGEDLKRMILESGDKLSARVLYHLPVGFCWEGRPGVTLLGDSAHLMTPFAGVGVNAALLDAMELGRAIVASENGEKDLASAIQEYEVGMFQRGEKFARKTMSGLIGHFSAGGNEHMVKRLRAAYGGAQELSDGCE